MAQVFERAQAAGLTNAYDYFAVFEAYLDVFVRKADAEHVRKNFANGATGVTVCVCASVWHCVRHCLCGTVCVTVSVTVCICLLPDIRLLFVLCSPTPHKRSHDIASISR